MSIAIVIPARYASSRYPGKPLAMLTGATGETRSLIERSWRAACAVGGVDRVVVATDDDRIAEASRAFGAEVLMTSSEARNGTDRCAEAVPHLPGAEIVVNFQGDAPLTPPWFVEDIIAGLAANPDVDMATPVLRCSGPMVASLREDRLAGRVGATTAVMTPENRALYFSKEVIPFTSDIYGTEDTTPIFHHVGVYAYRPKALLAYAKWAQGPLERLEGLEQLRFLENGGSILCVEVEARSRDFWELNNPQDVPKIERMMKEMGIQ